MNDTDLTSKAVDEKDIEALTVQHELAAAWDALTCSSKCASAKRAVLVMSSIQGAVESVRSLALDSSSSQQAQGSTDVLVTGSLHLVGGTMAVASLPVT